MYTTDRLLSAGPRLARVLLLVALGLAALAASLLATPGAASAATPGAAATARQAPLDDSDDVADDASADDDGAFDDEDDAADEDSADDDGSIEEDDLTEDDEDDELVLVVDRRDRALETPKAFAPTSTARGTNLRWKAWGDASATGTGRLSFRTKGRRGTHVKGTGTIRLSRLVTCDDGTAVYRRATLTVPHRGRVVANLPGCSATED